MDVYVWKRDQLLCNNFEQSVVGSWYWHIGSCWALQTKQKVASPVGCLALYTFLVVLRILWVLFSFCHVMISFAIL